MFRKCTENCLQLSTLAVAAPSSAVGKHLPLGWAADHKNCALAQGNQTGISAGRVAGSNSVGAIKLLHRVFCLGTIKTQLLEGWI